MTWVRTTPVNTSQVPTYGSFASSLSAACNKAPAEKKNDTRNTRYCEHQKRDLLMPALSKHSNLFSSHAPFQSIRYLQENMKRTERKPQQISRPHAQKKTEPIVLMSEDVAFSIPIVASPARTTGKNGTHVAANIPPTRHKNNETCCLRVRGCCVFHPNRSVTCKNKWVLHRKHAAPKHPAKRRTNPRTLDWPGHYWTKLAHLHNKRSCVLTANAHRTTHTSMMTL